MASCTNYQEELSALLDQELKSELGAEIESHLVECADCAERFETMKRLSTLISVDSVKDLEIPDIWEGMKENVPSVCAVIEEDLSAYLDGELPPTAQKGVNNHLDECPACLDKFKHLNSTNQLLSKGLELPEGMEVDLWSSVKERLTKDCEVIRSELSAYLDQEVVATRHRSITGHLMECLPCRAKFDKMASVGDSIREHYRPEIPEDLDLWPEIKSKMRVVPFKQKEKPQQQPQKIKRARPRLSVVAAAVAAMAGFVSMAIWLSSPDYSDIKTVKAEAYLIESSFEEPANMVEAVVYEQ